MGFTSGGWLVRDCHREDPGGGLNWVEGKVLQAPQGTAAHVWTGGGCNAVPHAEARLTVPLHTHDHRWHISPASPTHSPGRICDCSAMLLHHSFCSLFRLDPPSEC